MNTSAKLITIFILMLCGQLMHTLAGTHAGEEPKNVLAGIPGLTDACCRLM